MKSYFSVSKLLARTKMKTNIGLLEVSACLNAVEEFLRLSSSLFWHRHVHVGLEYTLFFYKEPVYKEPTCRRPKYLKNLYY